MTVPITISTQRAPIADDLFCQTCGYNLRALTGDVCPECGGSLDGVRSEVCNIPWVHRRELGWWRAYWRTIGFAMFHQPRFAEEMARPVGYVDSQRFRWITVGMVAIPVLLTVVAAYFLSPPVRHQQNWVSLAIADVWPVALEYVCLVLFLAAATGVPSYFFQPKDVPVTQQARAIALSYYACGPLAISFIPLACLIAGVALTRAAERVALALILVALTVPVGQVFAWWADLMHLSRRLTPQIRRRGGVAIVLPLLWVLLAFLILVALPFCLLGVVGVFVSLA